LWLLRSPAARTSRPLVDAQTVAARLLPSAPRSAPAALFWSCLGCAAAALGAAFVGGGTFRGSLSWVPSRPRLPLGAPSDEHLNETKHIILYHFRRGRGTPPPRPRKNDKSPAIQNLECFVSFHCQSCNSRAAGAGGSCVVLGRFFVRGPLRASPRHPVARAQALRCRFVRGGLRAALRWSGSRGVGGAPAPPSSHPATHGRRGGSTFPTRYGLFEAFSRYILRFYAFFKVFLRFAAYHISVPTGWRLSLSSRRPSLLQATSERAENLRVVFASCVYGKRGTLKSP